MPTGGSSQKADARPSRGSPEAREKGRFQFSETRGATGSFRTLEQISDFSFGSDIGQFSRALGRSQISDLRSQISDLRYLQL